MRAGTWLNFRDIKAARLSWQRARQVADRLPADEPDRAGMRIAPRALLCGTAFRVSGLDEAAFDELRELSTAADDKVSLAMAMAGHVMALAFRGRYRESSRSGLTARRPDRVDRRPDVDGGADVHGHRSQGWRPARLAKFCGWRQQSSNWPTAMRTRAT